MSNEEVQGILPSCQEASLSGRLRYRWEAEEGES